MYGVIIIRLRNDCEYPTTKIGLIVKVEKEIRRSSVIYIENNHTSMRKIFVKSQIKFGFPIPLIKFICQNMS